MPIYWPCFSSSIKHRIARNANSDSVNPCGRLVAGNSASRWSVAFRWHKRIIRLRSKSTILWLWSFADNCHWADTKTSWIQDNDFEHQAVLIGCPTDASSKAFDTALIATRPLTLSSQNPSSSKPSVISYFTYAPTGLEKALQQTQRRADSSQNRNQQISIIVETWRMPFLPIYFILSS